MATEIKLPALGENVDSGTVTKILVAVGDALTDDQPILELDTEKAAVEVPASASGTVKEIHVKEGDTIEVGQLLLTLEAGEAAKVEEPQPEAKAQPQAEEKTQEEKPTAEKKEEKKEEKAQAQPKAEEQPKEEEEKQTAEQKEEKKDEKAQATAKPSKPQATAAQPKKEPEKKAAPEAKAESAVEKKAEEKPEKEPEKEPPAMGKAAPEPAPAAPSVHRLARELGLDLNEVTGSGPDGRISETDVKNYARSIIRNAVHAPPAMPLPDFAQWGEIERQPMSGVRRKTAEHTSAAWAEIPHVTHFDQADITELEAWRAGLKQEAEGSEVKLTITAIVLKVAAAALQAFPQINVSADAINSEIIYKKYLHLGVAVDTERGLLVPVVRDVAQKNLTELATELHQLAEKARAGKLTLEEMQGGTFTVTNLGGIGGTAFTPIVNAPEAAILGLARASTRPVFKEGKFEPRLLLPLALTYDHRVIDGADAARFLRWIVQALEQPFLLALQG
jgi:pyruvate dehydrogenase E2 component (dihydrolipoamide acetyltransferase)